MIKSSALSEILNKSLNTIGFAYKGTHISNRHDVDTDSMKVVNIGKLDGSRIMIVAQDSDGMFWIEAAASKIVS